MTKLDEERKRKKSLGQLEEIVENLGQDSEEKASKIAIELFKKEREENEKKDISTVEKLDDARKKFDSVYYRAILAECNLRMKEYDLPMGFRWIAKVSKDGLAIYIETPNKQQYGGGVRIVGDPFIDAKGTIGLVRQALIDVDLLNEQWKILSSIKTKN